MFITGSGGAPERRKGLMMMKVERKGIKGLIKEKRKGLR